MLLTKETDLGTYQINALESRKITINGQDYTGSVIIGQSELITDWPVTSIAALTEAQLAPILGLKPALVLLGTGKVSLMPDSRWLTLFERSGIGIECMNTFAACSTLRVLSAEKRNVVAALLLD